MNRREIFKTGLGSIAAASAGWPMIGPAQAADWPTKAIRVVVPYAAGSATDLVPRTVFEQVGHQVGQSFIVENRPGGGTTIGSAQVKAAEPDGHTILIHSNAIVTVPAIQLNVPYDPVKDFSGLTPLGNVPLVLVIAPSKGIKNVQELVAKAKAKPGELNYGAAGIGTPPHLAMERFRLAAGFEGQLVPFKGAPEALTEVMTGRIDIYFCPITPALPLIQRRQGAGARGVEFQARVGAARRADHDRGRRAGFRFRFLGGRLRAEADAARRGRQDAGRDRQGDQQSGDQGAS